MDISDVKTVDALTTRLACPREKWNGMAMIW